MVVLDCTEYQGIPVCLLHERLALALEGIFGSFQRRVDEGDYLQTGAELVFEAE